jgi:CRP-like cAMP-binding protein
VTTPNPDDFGGICNDGDLADRISEAAQRIAGLTDRTKLTRFAKRLYRIGNQLGDLSERLEHRW